MGDGVIKYDASQSVGQVALRMQNTIFPVLMKKPEYWLFIGVHFSLTFLYTSGIVIPDPNSPSNGPLVPVMTQLTVIFVVMYTNNCFKRYFGLYDKVRALMACIPELVQECRMRIDNKQQRAKIVGYTMAGVLDYFIEAVDGGDDKPPDPGLQMLEKHHMLNYTELCFLKTVPKEKRYLIMFQWSTEVARLGLGSGGLRYLNLFTSKVMGIRRAQQDVSDTLEVPMPWQYFHLFSVLITMDLILLADMSAMHCSAVVSIGYMLVLTLLLGLREVSIGMSDPFGDDPVDFPIKYWLFQLFSECAVLLEHEGPLEWQKGSGG